MKSGSYVDPKDIIHIVEYLEENKPQIEYLLELSKVNMPNDFKFGDFVNYKNKKIWFTYKDRLDPGHEIKIEIVKP